MKASILVVGGAGFIGSHVAVELSESGADVIIVDNYENSEPGIADRFAAMGLVRPKVIEANVCDKAAMDAVFANNKIDAVVHLAGKKAVGESVSEPLLYYSSNLIGAMTLLDAMLQHSVHSLVFSSSATVYGSPKSNPIREHAPLAPSSPYGHTKLMIEQMIADVAVAQPDFSAISLRYFNPVGARPGGQIGERPKGNPNNLFPFIAQTAAGVRDCVHVFGADYPTTDGTGVRDYVHVVDLARGHVAALQHVLSKRSPRGLHQAVNLGTGRGSSVLEAIKAFERASGRRIPYEIAPRRPGDIANCTADPGLAKELLGWEATMGLDQMCVDHWAFQKMVSDRDATG